MAANPAEHDRQLQSELVRACRLANEDSEVAAIEREMDAFQDPIEEPWDESPSANLGRCEVLRTPAGGDR